MTAPTTTADRLAIAATAFDLAAQRLREADEALAGLTGLAGLASMAAEATARRLENGATGLRDEARALREAAATPKPETA